VDDEIEGIVRLFESDEHDPVNIGNPHEFTIMQLADFILRLTGSSSKLVREPLPTDDPKQRKPDISRAKLLLGWEPAVPLEEGLRRTIEHFRKVVIE
jgi:dTDP-glucose 4,6-dehydratase